MEKIMKTAVRRSDNWPGWPLRKGNRRTNKKMVLTSWAEGMWQHVHRHIPFRLHHSRWRGPPVACRTAEDGPHNTPAHPSVASYKQRQRESINDRLPATACSGDDALTRKTINTTITIDPIEVEMSARIGAITGRRGAWTHTAAGRPAPEGPALTSVTICV